VSHTAIRRGKHRVHDRELRTDKIVGGGWWWECRCGERGSWQATRGAAITAKVQHDRDDCKLR
jgi:hypothetical protein